MTANRTRNRTALFKAIACVAWCACFLIGTQAFGKQKTNSDQARRRKAARQPMVDSYWVWLHEEVPYIITDTERARFKSLKTDADREQFIERFWERRDPRPETPENEFKEEYYRRVAFANEHFACDIPGWKTDRGRIYIQYGPPDGIDSHPNGGTQPAWVPGQGMEPQKVSYPFETWRYNRLGILSKDVMVRFADPKKNGNFVRVLNPGEEDPLKFIPHSGLPDPTASPSPLKPPGAGRPKPN